MTAATLPEHLIERSRIQDMEPGDADNFIPQAMIVDHNGQCWLRVDMKHEPHLRIGQPYITVYREEDGYHVLAFNGARWRREGLNFSMVDCIPVTTIRSPEEEL